MRHRLVVCAVFACALGATAAGAAPPWTEVKSAHFTVVTDAGEKEGRRVAWQFEQIRAALVELWPWARIDSGRPFVIVAARDEATLKTLGPQYWEGKRFRPVSFGVAGRDRQFIALRTDVREPDDFSSNPYQSAYWSYVSSVFNRSFPGRVPAWYSRGIAEVMSNTLVRDKELRVGLPLRSNLHAMRERAPVPLRELLSAEHGSRWLTQETEVRLFDASAWALVHYLMFGEQGAFAPKVNAFNRLLYAGKDPDAALAEAFGDMKPYHDGMRRYVERDLFAYARIPVAVGTRPEAYAARPLAPAEAAVLRGEMLAAMGRPVEARALAAEAAKADPGLAGPWEIEASLLDREKRTAEAKAAYAKAAAAGSKRAHVYYRLAQLEWTPDADKAAREGLAANLEKARALDPESADTLAFLADLRVDLDQPEEALALATKAVEIEPAESYHRLARARALWALQRSDEAVAMARSALAAADSDDERRHAQSFLDFAARAGGPSAAARPSARAADPGAAAAAETTNAGTPDADELARACRAGARTACAGEAFLRAVQARPGSTEATLALSRLERLCDDGIEAGCLSWASALARLGAPSADQQKARDIVETICDNKNAQACALLKSLPR